MSAVGPCTLVRVSAYRTASPSGPEPPRDVRELTLRRLGTIALVSWTGLAVISGAVIAAALRWGTGPDFDVAHGMRLVFIGTVLTTAFAALLVVLSDEKLRFVVRVEDGVLEVTKRRVLRRTDHRSFHLRDVARVSVDEHGEDHVAVYLHFGKKTTPVFVTLIGDDARRVEAFLDSGVAAWRAFTALPEP